tara:strand:+ start:12240 stop:12392 length:153 start_codon:yes stop_codon:yes gene_type:complete
MELECKTSSAERDKDKNMDNRRVKCIARGVLPRASSRRLLFNKTPLKYDS